MKIEEGLLQKKILKIAPSTESDYTHVPHTCMAAVTPLVNIFKAFS